MKLFAQICVAALGLEHFAIMYIEIFLWNKPYGLKAFSQTQAQADASKTLAANQGLYNGFLAAGLLTSLWVDDWRGQFFFALCVFIAGVYGGLTAKRSIFFLQALPAAICLLALFIAK